MNKIYEIKYQDKSIFSNGNLDYLFDALHDPTNEPIPNTRDDIISLANFICVDDKEIIKRKRGRPKTLLAIRDKIRCRRGRPPKKPITTAMMHDKLLDMLRNYQLENGIEPTSIETSVEPFCIT